jgi:WXG100 family type VII secretion target
MDGDGYMLYDFASLDELAGSIDGRVNAMHNLVEDLRTKVNNLSSQYEGAASSGFMKTRTDWNNAATDLNAVLAKISIAVKKTREDAHATENTNTNRW